MADSDDPADAVRFGPPSPSEAAVAEAGSALLDRRAPLAERAFLKATSNQFLSEFGGPIAIDGNTLVAAAAFTDIFYDSDGAAFVFVRDGAGWSQQAILNVPFSESDDGLFFGTSVAIQGNVIAVGTPRQRGDGTVHIFERTGTVWNRTAVLTPLSRTIDGSGEFGYSLALDGDRLAVGAPGDWSASTGVGGDPTNQDAPWSGAAYVFTREDDGWELEAYIKPSNTTAEFFFGVQVALAGDTLAIGEVDDSSATGVNGDQTNRDSPNSGAVFVFERGASGWAQQAYIKASNTEADDAFGTGGTSGIAVSGDTLVVSAPAEDSAATDVGGDQASNEAPNSGAVYVFTRRGTTWLQQAYIKASNTGVGDRFGDGIAVARDTLAVSAFREDSDATGIDGDQTNDAAPDSGAAYLFERRGRWRQTHYVKASNATAGDLFGFGLALGGRRLAVGAIRQYICPDPEPDPDNLCLREGAVYVFR